MYVLFLNPMTSNIENMQAVCRAETVEQLTAYIKSQLASEAWQDGGFFKVFKKGSRLEWYNGIDEIYGEQIVDVGTEETWADEARRRYDDEIMSLPEVP